MLFNLKCSTVMMTKQNFTSKHSIQFIHWCGHFGKILVSTIFVASNFRFLSWSAQLYIDLTSKVLMIYGTESTLLFRYASYGFLFQFFFLYILLNQYFIKLRKFHIYIWRNKHILKNTTASNSNSAITVPRVQAGCLSRTIASC